MINFYPADLWICSEWGAYFVLALHITSVLAGDAMCCGAGKDDPSCIWDHYYDGG